MRFKALVIGAAVAGLLTAVAPSSSAASKSLPIDISKLRNSQCIVPDYVLYATCAVDPYRSYVASTMPTTAQITVNNVTFNWPNVGSTPMYGTKDTVMADGRVVTVPANVKGYKALSALLVMKPGRPAKAPIVFTITYLGGSTEKLTATACDMAYKNAGVLPKVRAQYITYAVTHATIAAGEGCMDQAIMPINSKKTVKSITLPSTGDMIYALSFTMEKSMPKKGPVFQ